MVAKEDEGSMASVKNTENESTGDEEYLDGSIKELNLYNLSKGHEKERPLFFGHRIANADNSEGVKCALSVGIGAFSNFLNVSIQMPDGEDVDRMISISELFAAVAEVVNI